MRILITGALVLAGWLGLGGYWHVCQIRCLCDDNSSPPIQMVNENPTEIPDGDESLLASVPWNITDGQNVILTFPASTRLLQNSPEVEIDPEAEGFADSLFMAMQDKQGGTIQVTGLYDPSETAPEGFPTMGHARAAQIKERLVYAGIDPVSIVTAVRSTQLNFNSKGMTAGGIELGLLDSGNMMEGEDPAESDLAKSAPSADDDISRKTLYCNFGRSAFNSDPDLDSYAEKAKAHLEANPEKTMYLTGHTDHKGDQKTNMQYGRSRAAKARRFFRDNGIPLRRIKIASKGENEPIATNETEEGQALNRRVEIIIE